MKKHVIVSIRCGFYRYIRSCRDRAARASGVIEIRERCPVFHGSRFLLPFGRRDWKRDDRL
jgi:hypothetical protein